MCKHINIKCISRYSKRMHQENTTRDTIFAQTSRFLKFVLKFDGSFRSKQTLQKHDMKRVGVLREAFTTHSYRRLASRPIRYGLASGRKLMFMLYLWHRDIRFLRAARSLCATVDENAAADTRNILITIMETDKIEIK